MMAGRAQVPTDQAAAPLLGASAGASSPGSAAAAPEHAGEAVAIAGRPKPRVTLEPLPQAAGLPPVQLDSTSAEHDGEAGAAERFVATTGNIRAHACSFEYVHAPPTPCPPTTRPDAEEHCFDPRLQLSAGEANKTVHVDHVMQLEQGCQLWDHLPETTAMSIPKSLQNANYFPSRYWDERSVNQHYLTATFKEDTVVHVLFHSNTTVPTWLTERFKPLKDMSISVDWRFSTAFRISLMLADSHQRMKQSSLKVWALKSGTLPAGQPLVLGGAAAAGVSQCGYIFCWKALDDQEGEDYLHRLEAPPSRSEAMFTQKRLNDSLVEAIFECDVEKAEKLLKAGANVTITLTRSRHGVPRGALLTNAAAATHNMPMLCCLLDHGAELDWASLDFLVRQSDLLPASRGGLEKLLTGYVRTRRNPLNTCYAIAYSLNAAKKTEKTAGLAVEFGKLSDKYRRAALDLVEDLSKLSDGFTHPVRGRLTAAKVLAPTEHWDKLQPIHLADVTRTAARLRDTEFTSTNIVRRFVGQAWYGDIYIQQSHDAVETSINNNGFVSRFMKACGFCGPVGEPAIQVFSSFLHILVFSHRAFYNSPRGRWCFRVLMQLYLLVLFHACLFLPKAPERLKCAPIPGDPATTWADGAPTMRAERGAFAGMHTSQDGPLATNLYLLVALMAALCVWALGMLLDFGLVLRAQFNSSISRLMTQSQSFILHDAAMGVLLSVTGTLWIGTEFEMDKILQSPADIALVCAGAKPAPMMGMYRAMKILFSVCAFTLWAHTLLVLRPISKNLGPLLYVIGTMMAEVLLFLVPLAALIMGFAAALFSLFPDHRAESFGWDSLQAVCMFLFQFFVGDFKFDVLLRAQRDCTDPLTCPDSTLTTYSIVVLVIYAVLGTILMANLLIAILTYKYDPATIDAESTFQRSQTLQTYQAQVKMHMLPAPFSPLLVLTSQLPSRTREAIPATIFTNALLPVLDGTNLADGKAMQLPTGAAELPYLLYLVWFTPWVAATMMAVALFMLPYCVVSFAITQAVRLTRRAHLRQQTLRTRRREERRRSAMDDDGSTGNVLKSPATRRKSHWRRWVRRLWRLLRGLLGMLARALLLVLLLPVGMALYSLGLVLLVAWLVLWAFPATLLFHATWMLLGVGLLPQRLSRRVHGMLKRATTAAEEPAAASRFRSMLTVPSRQFKSGDIWSNISGAGHPFQPQLRRARRGRAWTGMIEKYHLSRWEVFTPEEVNMALLGADLQLHTEEEEEGDKEGPDSERAEGAEDSAGSSDPRLERSLPPVNEGRTPALAPSPSRSPYAEEPDGRHPAREGSPARRQAADHDVALCDAQGDARDAPGRRSFEADLAGGAAARPSAVDNELLSLL
eukprot:jgi/Tetstr1/429458/TSEL_019366.t1